MTQLDLESIFYNQFPKAKSYPKWIFKPIIYILKKIFCQDTINDVIKTNAHLEGFEFVEGVVEYFNISYKALSKEKLNIPPSGRVVIIANHPLGAMDALCLILLVREIRPDIKVVANELLMYLPQLHPWLIPVDAMNGKSQKDSIKSIYKALKEEQAVIMFPSGEVSRVRPTGLRDTKWNKGFLNFAKKTNSPILPIYIKARNSSLFYTISMINKPLAAYLLPQEMVKKRNGVIEYRIGEIIPYKSIAEMPITSDKQSATLIQKHLYRVGRGKSGIIKTQTCIAHPEDRQKLKEELRNAQILGKTSDGKIIYLFDFFKESAIMREIGRLREFTFRKVEEGTGGKRDIDRYDEYYRHLVLWDENDLEIVGAYRLGEANFIMQEKGVEGFYSNTLFEFLDDFKPYLENSVEMGRSFVQPKYWGSRALDYLWQGIGAYLHVNKNIKYLFGPVSLSNTYPKVAKNMIIHFYKQYFSPPTSLVKEREPFIISKNELDEIKCVCETKNYRDDFRCLKSKLPFSTSIPTLYKQYADLCDEGGMYFAGFNVDHDFSDCVDSFIVVHVEQIKQNKKDRYIK